MTSAKSDALDLPADSRSMVGMVVFSDDVSVVPLRRDALADLGADEIMSTQHSVNHRGERCFLSDLIEIGGSRGERGACAHDRHPQIAIDVDQWSLDAVDVDNVGALIVTDIDRSEMGLDRAELNSIALVAEQATLCDVVAQRPLAVVRERDVDALRLCEELMVQLRRPGGLQ